MGKKKGVTASRLNVMIRDLREMKAYLLPDVPDAVFNEQELENMDDFEKQKLKLSTHINTLIENIRELNEVRARKEQRDQRVIAMQNDNSKGIQEARNLWLTLKDVLVKQAKKGKITKEVLDDRTKMLELLGNELAKLEKANSNINIPEQNNETASTMDRSAAKRAERDARRAARRERLAQNPSGAGAEEDPDAAPPSEAQKQFMEQKIQVDHKIDGMLDQVSDALKELHQIATDINKNLDIQNDLLREVDTKMDGTIENYVNANQRLKKFIADNTGGATTWCPIVITCVIFLGLIGYIYNISK